MNLKKILSFIVLAILAVISQFFTDWNKPKSEQTKEPKTSKTSSLPASDLGNYDVQMKNDRLKQNIVETDYYLLALSWSPAFCQNQKRNNNGKIPPHLQYQCGDATRFGWVIHGLWPQSGTALSVDEHPRYCQGDLPMVEEQTIRKYLPESPGARLLQGEWEKHGACAFNRAEDYFEKQKMLFNSLKLPDFATPRLEVFKWVRANNPHLSHVYLGSGKDELYICYDKQWQPMDCPR